MIIGLLRKILYVYPLFFLGLIHVLLICMLSTNDNFIFSSDYCVYQALEIEVNRTQVLQRNVPIYWPFSSTRLFFLFAKTWVNETCACFFFGRRYSVGFAYLKHR